MKKRLISVDVSGVNWGLLEDQKDAILQLRGILECKPDADARRYVKALNGIIHLLDHIQDQAVEQIPMREVFSTDK